ncbi:MAG: biopolymer transporter ExbD [Fibromonadaceae bacterium]|jgi:biopolymer transport protein ExbD|nr:biopolymer transporter ExbD [Fibromonadaceae bacterium]
MSFVKRYKNRDDVGIDIAPMLDMVFILLIFFVVTSSFVRETGLDVNKPKASSAQELARESILIGISREGTIHINESQVDMRTLRSILQQMTAEKPDRAAVIVADRDAPSGKVVDVLDVCNLARIKKVSIAANVSVE